ncbi:MAG: thymidine phosphorylase [Bdellovibrionales bacterium]
MEFLMTEFIKKKKTGQELQKEEIDQFIKRYSSNEIPDYQAAAWLMASFLNGLTELEASCLTKSMQHSGYCFDFSHLPEAKVDKHSTGGVGDKTSMILAPIVAACGIRVPMIAGRGLGHTGGTLDKLDAIKGFDTKISKEEFIKNIEDLNFSIMGQTEEICPADKKLYSLRDVTATVDSIPLICASIMSKKLAEGIDGLVLDVKTGSGAFMKTLDDAKSLARALKKIGEDNSCKVTAVISDMNQPLGRHCGNANEIYECVELLKNNKSEIEENKDTFELSINLAAHMISLGKGISLNEANELALKSIESGEAYAKFLELVNVQGGDISSIKKPEYFYEIKSNATGYVKEIDTESIGTAGIAIKAGRTKITDPLNYNAGIYINKKIGDFVEKGEVLLKVNADEKDFHSAQNLLEQAYTLAQLKPSDLPLIYEVIS